MTGLAATCRQQARCDEPVIPSLSYLVTYACRRGVRGCIEKNPGCRESCDRSAKAISQTASFRQMFNREMQPHGGHEMKFQVLSLVTLLASFSFQLSAMTATVQQAAGANDPNKRLGLDISALKQQAQGGDANAQYKLGRSYMTGSGVAQDYEQALEWSTKAAKQGSADAEFLMGYMHEHGLGVKKDYGKAFLYYSSAAKDGHSTAQNNLGSMYERGEGLRKNLVEAAAWYQKAADQRDPVAQCNLASIYLLGKGTTKNDEQAAVWFKAAAELGYAPAEENLAWMYYTGTGLTLDPHQAAQWVRKAAEQGYAPAQLDLGYLYEHGRGVSLDYSAAYMWYKAAADRGMKTAGAQLRKLSELLTPAQVEQASEAAAKITGAMPQTDMGSGTTSVSGLFHRH